MTALAILLASTSLQITVWTSDTAKAQHFTLRCNPVAGTLPHRAAACRKLLGMTRPFAPTPKNVACTDIYGGPQRARITGRLRGFSVRAEFSRTNGCEIGRWERVRFLFPIAVGANGS
ncbi:MAG: SSI family serine proteinase inhibitor [Gaiellaceae bacterium]